MKIRNQIWIKKDDNYYMIRLHQPFWSAWQRYGWEDGVAGIGLSAEIINKCINENCGIVVNIEKYGVYHLSKDKIEKYRSINYLFQTKDKKYLYEYPLSEFRMVVKSKEDIQNEEKKESKRLDQKQLF